MSRGGRIQLGQHTPASSGRFSQGAAMKVQDYLVEDATKPGLGSKTVVPSDSAEIWEGEYARQLVVFAEGAVCFVGADGAEDTWTFTSDMAYPQRIEVAVSKVKSTGTSVGAGNIKAVR